jgi:very-short-patch-repair endonuclease
MATSTSHHSSGLLWRLSLRQHGVITHEQLRAYGMGSEAIRHRLRTGRLHPLGRGVYAVGRPQVSREGRWLAAVLACGAHATLSHGSAAALWGIRPGPATAVTHVSVPADSDRRRPGVRVHRVIGLDLADVRRREGIAVVSPARTLLNQAAVVSPRRLEADVNAADVHGLISPPQLQASLARFAGQPGIAALRALVDRHTFRLTRSELERLFLPVTARAGLPTPQTQRRVNGFEVDFFWPALGLVVETDGLRYHRTPAQQARDLIREQTHRATGIEALRFTHWQVAHDRGWVIGTLRAVAARLR